MVRYSPEELEELVLELEDRIDDLEKALLKIEDAPSEQ